MRVINTIKDVTKLKIPANHVLLEIVNVEPESDIETPDGVESEEISDTYSKVVAVGDSCKRYVVGDVVFMMQHLPPGFHANGKNYMITYEENCAIGSSWDNLELSNNRSKGIIV